MLKININSLQSQILSNKKSYKRGINHYSKDILTKLTTKEDVLALTSNVSKKKNVFMSHMMYKYETANFYKKIGEKEDLSHVKNIFMIVKNPNKEHYNLVDRLSDSFENLERIFVASNNKQKYLNFAVNVDKYILSKYKNARKELIPELLESPHHKKYVNNFEDIKSYLILNKENPNAVKWLDNMMSRKIFSKKHFDKGLQKENIKEHFPFATSTKILNPNTINSIYSESVEDLMSEASKYFYISAEMLKNGNDKDVFNILKTTSSKNLKIRKAVIQSFVSTLKQGSLTQKSEYATELNKLFCLLDKDKYARKFLKNTISVLPYNLKIKELNEIFTIIPSKKLETKKRAILNVLQNGSENSRLQVLKENSTFLPDENMFAKFFKNVSNVFKLKNKVNNSNSEIIMSKRVLERELQPKPVVSNSSKEIGQNLEHKVSEKVEKTAKLAVIKPENIDKKQMVKNAVLGLVNKKLGTKTFEKQRDIYSANATKMRLSMLPEIFASITDTRKTDKAIGKLRSNSSNKDAIVLFSKINGSNKKLVNYLLKKRNVDNTRMFEIKDIISILEKAETKIAKDKIVNPDYRAKDARKYYNHLYEAKIEQYGKVKRQTFNA